QPVTIEELKKIIALRDLPDEHLEWILAHSEYEEFEDGDMLYQTGDPIEAMAFLLEGKIYFYLNVNGKLVYYFSFENDDLSGGVTGLLPYSRMKKSPGTSYAVGKLRLVKLHKKYFAELEKLNPDFNQRLIGYMTERARVFATTQMQQEKVSALGKLAAGIAHEMNNPAAAINRISSELDKRLKKNFELTEELLKHNITPGIIRNIREIVRNKEDNLSAKTKITPLQRIQKEDELNDWLNEKGINGRNEIAETLTEAGFSQDDLERINRDVPNDAFQNILDWLENLLSSELLIKDMGNASGRISLLVGAIKSHVRMDRSGDIHTTNIHEDLENTLILLGYKIRDKKIKLIKNFCDDMTEVEAHIGELNQVWTNLIDNAIYAVPQNGEIIIETLCDKKDITVKITDNGTGIPKEILSRVFDPFFTTKKVGEGTGIGLDIVKNVITRHNGEVKVNSIPGKTEFIIRIPVSQQSLKKESNDETSIHNNN
ncbi:MAG: ATP-binding protein, partial [Ignavibacteriaceae bacterium]